MHPFLNQSRTNISGVGCRPKEPARALWKHGPTLRGLDTRQHFGVAFRGRFRPSLTSRVSPLHHDQGAPLEAITE
jgi:hypothetical protein